jgi:hypothetical protein
MAIAAVGGQQPAFSSARSAFEVASVKPNQCGGLGIQVNTKVLVIDRVERPTPD